MAKKGRKESEEERKLQRDLDEMKKTLADLRVKLGMTGKRDLTKVPTKAAKRIGETASDVVKMASEVVERALRVVQFAAFGAMEGAKRALIEGDREEQRATTKSRTRKKNS